MKDQFIYNKGNTSRQPYGTKGKYVEVVLRDCTYVLELNHTAENYDWEHVGAIYDIIAYRIIEGSQ